MDAPDNTIKHLFQQEFSKMVAVLIKRFGIEHMQAAEDLVSETFLVAAETWGIKGIPPNPAAWLYAVARQKALYQLRRNKIFEQKVIPGIKVIQEQSELLDFSPGYIKDSQLAMLFAICDPSIASEAQIGLALRILCGFGIDEIAEAFLTNKENINKRLFRARERLRAAKVAMEMPAARGIEKRLDNVLHIIYLLFNEGYYSKTQNEILRKDLCLEAMRLGLLLTEYKATNRPKTNALIALMCFHASRFEAREGHVLYAQQDESLWDKDLIKQGLHYLDLSFQGEEISSYHLEARIASLHIQKEDTTEKWKAILEAYDQLQLINYSPAVALNRIFALYKVAGPGRALPQALKLGLESNHFYELLLGELYSHSDKNKALLHFKKAQALSKTQAEKQGIQDKIDYMLSDR
jgi:predicted RNA polymerase sigma factor